jgi:excisionase family DNA binding protein
MLLPTDQTRNAVFNSVEELANHIGLSLSSTHKGLRAGMIPSIRVGKRFIISRAAVQRWLDALDHKPKGAPSDIGA